MKDFSVFLDMRRYKNWVCKVISWEYLSEDLSCQFPGVRARMLCHFSCILFLATLWTIVCQAPLSMAFSRKECWSGLPCPSPGDLLNPRIEPASPMSPALAGGFFATSAIWEKWLTSALQAELLQRVLKVSSCSNTWFTLCRGEWQAPTASASLWLIPLSYGVICYTAIDNQSYCSTIIYWNHSTMFRIKFHLWSDIKILIQFAHQAL